MLFPFRITLDSADQPLLQQRPPLGYEPNPYTSLLTYSPAPHPTGHPSCCCQIAKTHFKPHACLPGLIRYLRDWKRTTNRVVATAFSVISYQKLWYKRGNIVQKFYYRFLNKKQIAPNQAAWTATGTEIIPKIWGQHHIEYCKCFPRTKDLCWQSFHSGLFDTTLCFNCWQHSFVLIGDLQV